MSDRVKIERPRGTHDVVPAEMAALAAASPARSSGSAALYGYRRIVTPVFEDTALFARTSGAGSDVVQKEMYTLHRSLGPLAHAASRGHRADLPCVRRARHAPRPAAGQALHDRLDVPVRRARPGPVPRALAGLRRGARQRRPRDRRRADPALRHAARPPRRHALPPRAELDRLPRLPARVPRGAARLAGRERRAPRRGHARKGRRQPAPRVRQLPRQAAGGPRRARRGAEDRRVALRRLRRALRRRPGGPRRDRRAATRSSRPSCAASTTTRARRSSSSARPRTRTRPSPAAAATTTSSRRSAARRRPGSASARGSSGS